MGLKALAQQFFKFMIVGGLSFAIETAVLVGLHELFRVPTVPASVIAFMVSMIVNYTLSMRHVFEHRESLSRGHEFAIFVILSLVGLGLNTLIMWGSAELCTAMGIDYEKSLWYLVAKVGATAVVSLWNFFSRRHWLDAGNDREG